MKYSVETTKNGYVETLKVDGREYKKTWCETNIGARCCDEQFYKQLEEDGAKNEAFLDGVHDEIDNTFFAHNFKEIERSLEW